MQSINKFSWNSVLITLNVSIKWWKGVGGELFDDFHGVRGFGQRVWAIPLLPSISAIHTFSRVRMKLNTCQLFFSVLSMKNKAYWDDSHLRLKFEKKHTRKNHEVLCFPKQLFYTSLNVWDFLAEVSRGVLNTRTTEGRMFFHLWKTCFKEVPRQSRSYLIENEKKAFFSFRGRERVRIRWGTNINFINQWLLFE